MSNKKSALGRGFDGLIPTGFNVADVAAPGEQIRQIEASKLFANPDQPRKSFDEKTLQELADSIIEHGIIQPLVVTPHKDGFRVVAGERRLRASQIAGLRKVPVIIRDHKELEELEVALVENVQRVDLSPLETAVSIVRLRDQFSLPPKEIARKLGKAETTISNIIRLLKLPSEAIEALQTSKISEGHARAILALKDNETAQKKLLESIMNQKLNVRDAESLVHELKKSKNINEQKNSSISSKTKKRLESLKLRGISVNIRYKKQGGTLYLDYKNEEELDNLLSKF